MKRWLYAFCLILIAGNSLGASSWEGSAMMSAYGEFPDSGFYGACNSFPRNTAVEVVNLENGKTVTVIITKGSDNPGIFLLLSPEAARSLSMDPGMVSRVRVSAPRNITEALTPSSPTKDPDFNPSLLASREPESSVPKEAQAEAPAEETPPPPEPEVPAPVILAETEPEPEEPQPADTMLTEAETVPEAEPAAREAPLALPEAIVRSDVAPRKEKEVLAYMEIPESREPESAEDGNAVVYGLEKPETLGLVPEAELADPTLVPDELPEAALLRQTWPEDAPPSAELADCEIRMEEAGELEAVYLAEISPSEKEREPEVSLEEPAAAVETALLVQEEEPPSGGTESTVPQGKTDSEVLLSMEPAEERPPEAPAVGTVPLASKETPREPKPAASSRESGKYYIQIGAFRTSSSLNAAARRLDGSFPVVIETVKSGTGTLYKLFVGPLARDESGVTLVRVKSLGFRDAFLK